MRRWLAAAVLIGAVGACGPLCGNGKLNLSNPQIKPLSFTCPVGASNYDYDMTGSVDADNQSNNNITIRSLATSATVAKLEGSWELSVGSKSGVDNLSFSPKSIASGAKTTIQFATPWHCTNTGSNGATTYADFKIVLTIVTSAGTYKINLPTHRLTLA